MPNKVTFGLKEVHIALLTDPAVPTWAAPIAIPGAVKFSPKPEGQETKQYADDSLYFFDTTNDGYTGELEMTLVPDAVLASLLGWRVDANGALIEVSDGTPAEFALMFEVQGDAKNRRVVYYRCRAARAAQERTTTGEKLEPKTDSLALTIIPLTIAGERVVRNVLELSDANAAVYDAFFDAVVLPDSAAVKTALAAAIALATTLVEVSYTVGSWAIMDAARDAAVVVNADQDAVQPEIDAAHMALEATIIALVAV